MPGLSVRRSLPVFSGSPFSWTAYWESHYISDLSVGTTGSTTQTITATIIGSGIDGAVFEYSTNAADWTEAGTAADGIYSATGLKPNTLYFWRARLYKGTHYSDYCIIDYAVTDVPDALIAGWNLDGFDYFGNTGADNAQLDSVNKHSSAYFNGVTYISYMGNNDNPYIITYTHATGLYSAPVQIGVNPLINGNGHGQPAILIDSDGYIHCMFGAHVSAIQYSKSDNPEDISAWTVMGSPSTGTYPQLFQFSSGRIYMFYRYSFAGSYYWGYKYSDNGGTNWSANNGIFIDFAYGFPEKGVGDIIHLPFVAGTSDANRKNIYYIYFDGTNWYDIDDNVVAVPFSDGSSVLAYDSGDEWTCGVIAGCDSSNNPYMLFHEGHAADPVGGGPGTFARKILKRKDGSWQTFDLGCNSDHSSDWVVAFDVRTDTDIDTYLVQKGTADTAGGHIQKWISPDAGETWTFDELIKIGQYRLPTMIRDYTDSDVKLVFFEYAVDPTTWTRQGFLWGDSGFVRNTALAVIIAPEIRNLYPATIYNAPVQVAGKFNECFTYVAASLQYLSPGDQAAFSFTDGADLPFTISYWVNVPSEITTGFHVAKSIAAKCEYATVIGASKINIQIFSAGSSGDLLRANAVWSEINTWVFVCFTYDGGGEKEGLKIYKDCVESQYEQLETGVYVKMGNYDAPLMFARRYETLTPYYMTGMLDEIKMWNKVLSEAEMIAEMNNPV